MHTARITIQSANCPNRGKFLFAEVVFAQLMQLLARAPPTTTTLTNSCVDRVAFLAPGVVTNVGLVTRGAQCQGQPGGWKIFERSNGRRNFDIRGKIGLE